MPGAEEEKKPQLGSLSAGEKRHQGRLGGAGLDGGPAAGRRGVNGVPNQEAEGRSRSARASTSIVKPEPSVENGTTGIQATPDAAPSKPSAKKPPVFKPKVPKKKLKKALDTVKADSKVATSQHNIADESGFDLLRDRHQTRLEERANRGKRFRQDDREGKDQVAFEGIKREPGAEGSRGWGGSSGASGSKGGKKGGTVSIRDAVDDMTEDNTGTIAGGSLDYEQLYPTMLPFMPPPEEAALRGEQQIHVAAADSAAIQRAEKDVAASLSVREQDEESEQFFLVQLPPMIPQPNPKARRALEKDLNSLQLQSDDREPPAKALSPAQLPDGQVGRLKVYRSGKVKLQLGSVPFCLSQGIPCEIRHDLASINTEATPPRMVMLGDFEKRFVLVPDVDALLQEPIGEA